MTSTHEATIADLQRAIEELRRERDAAVADNAGLAGALTRRDSEYGERTEQQDAINGVLRTMAASPDDPQPAFDLIVERARAFCGADGAAVALRDGGMLHLRSHHGYATSTPGAFEARFPLRIDPSTIMGRTILTGDTVLVPDIFADAGHIASRTPAVDMHSVVGVPMLRGGAAIGVIALGRRSTGDFSTAQVELLRTFAEQAVIALSSAAALRGLRERTADLQEALEQQTATAEVLQVINASPGNLTPVLDAMLEKALRLCGGTIGGIFSIEGNRSVTRALKGVTPAFAAFQEQYPIDEIQPGTVPARIIDTRRPVQTPDVKAGESYRNGVPYARALADLGNIRAVLAVPLVKDAAVVGMITIYRQEVGAFSDKQVALLENFAAQAVIAMDNARLITEQREALEQQTATAEVLQVINASPGNLMPVFNAILEKSLRICQPAFGSLVTIEGDRGRTVAALGQTSDLKDFLARNPVLGFSRNVLRLIETGRPVHQPNIMEGEGYLSDHPGPRSVADLGGARTLLLVPLIKDQIVIGAIQIYRLEVRAFSEKEISLLENFAAQAVIAMENARLIDEIRTARDSAEATLRELKTTQANLIQAEKMASLGQLTAGIAHEIKNPLNFVNNFAVLSVDLLAELNEAAAPAFATLTGEQRADIDDMAATLTANLRKITEHGTRADGIVKAMLEHSRGASGERRITDINALADEALNLAYHGARAQDQSFNITLERDFGEGIAPIEVNPQDITRVLLNLFNNGFYAARKRETSGAGSGFSPTLKITTRDRGASVEIRVRDNGIGIPADIRDKLFQPFFTTKPTGEGTGLGLSITYDIVTKQHGGSISVESDVDDHSEFVITLPRGM